MGMLCGPPACAEPRERMTDKKEVGAGGDVRRAGEAGSSATGEVARRSLSDFKATYAEQMPRERLVRHGARQLETAELLAILIQTGTTGKTVMQLAQEMLDAFGGSLIRLADRTVSSLKAEFRGLGDAKAIALLAALELGRRAAKEEVLRKPILSAADAYDVLSSQLSTLDHEEIWVIVMDNSGNIKHFSQVSSGGFTASSLDMRMLMKTVLVNDGTCFILSHNHPSGVCSPSRNDDQLTEAVDAAARTLSLRFRDHIIVARGNGYYSYSDNGRMP